MAKDEKLPKKLLEDTIKKDYNHCTYELIQRYLAVVEDKEKEKSFREILQVRLKNNKYNHLIVKKTFYEVFFPEYLPQRKAKKPNKTASFMEWLQQEEEQQEENK